MLAVREWPANWETEAGKNAFLGESGAWEVIREERGERGHIEVVRSPGYESNLGGPYLDGIRIHVEPYPIIIFAGMQAAQFLGHFGPMMMKDEVAADIIGQAVWNPHIRVHTWGAGVSDEELELAAATGNWFPPDEVPTTLIDCRVRGYTSTDLPQSLDDWTHVWFDEESSCVSDEEAGVLYIPSGTATRKAQAVSDQSVPILSPGIAVGKEVWWWRPQHDDYTPPAVLENHPYGRQLTRLHSPDVWTLMLDQVVAVLREANPISADQEAEAIARMTKRGFVNGWGWEIADAHEPLVMYWSTVRWGDKAHRVGALVRYDSSGEPEGFVQASPEPMLTPELDLEGVWYAREQTGDTTPAGLYETHPHGPALDLMDGTFDYYHTELPEIQVEFFHKAEEYYMGMAFSTVSNTLRKKITEAEGLTGIKLAMRDIGERFNAKNIGWEVISQEEAEIRYWGRIGGHPPMKNEYIIGFTLRFETGQPEPSYIRKAQQRPPIDEFVDNPTLVGDVIVVPVE